MKKLKSLAALGLVSVLVVGCGSSGGDSDTKKIAKLAWDSDATVFDSTIENNATTLIMLNAQSEGLYRLEEDGTPVEGMAEKVEISDDETEYTFTLRDTEWANGEKVTADDFVFAFRRMFDTDVPDSVNNRFLTFKGLLGLKNSDELQAWIDYKAYLDNPDNYSNDDPEKSNIPEEAPEVKVEDLGIEAVDEKTVKITLQDPCPIIGSILAYPSFFPLNEKFVTDAGEKYGTSVDLTLACGPYKLTKWEASNTIAYEKNEGYYGADDIKVDGLEFKINTESTARALAYDSGEVMFTQLTSDLVAQYEGTEGYETKLESYLAYLSFNQNNPDFTNENLRRAMALSFNKQDLVDDVLKDGSQVANHIIPEGLAIGPDGKDFRESAGKDAVYLETDKEAAKTYFETAKQELGKDSFEFSLMVGERDPNKAIAEFLKQEIEENLPGVTITIDIQPSKTFYAIADTKQDYDILSIMWGPDYPYPTTYTDLWTSGGANNYAVYSSEKYDELQKATTSGDLLEDPEGRWEAFKEMEKLLLEEDVAVAPMYQRGWVGLINPKLEGIA
ncbi:MAG: peptide ABC transporter substrate-binding protein, partial [Coprobacillaceae bacterium]